MKTFDRKLESKFELSVRKSFQNLNVCFKNGSNLIFRFENGLKFKLSIREFTQNLNTRISIFL